MYRERRGDAVPGPRVDDPGQPGHRHRPPGRQPADHHRGQGKRQEIGDEPLSRTERREGPPPPARGGPVAQQQGEQDQRRQRPEERPGERQQGHPERQRDQRGHQQSRTEGEDGAGADQDRGPRAGLSPGPGQPGQGRVENTAGHQHTGQSQDEARPGPAGAEQPPQVVKHRERGQSGDLGSQHARRRRDGIHHGGLRHRQGDGHHDQSRAPGKATAAAAGGYPRSPAGAAASQHRAGPRPERRSARHLRITLRDIS